MNARSRLLLSLAAVLALVVAQSAVATVTTDLGTYTGPNIDFTLIEETTQNPLFGPSDDADAPLFGFPTSSSGNSLIFTPNAFIAAGTGGAFDEDHATLNIELQSVDPFVDGIELINISEFGDFTLDQVPPALPGGTAATSIFLQMTGSVKILEVNDGGVLTDVSANPNGEFAINGAFNIGTPSGAGPGGSGATFLSITDVNGGAGGAGTWTAVASLDINALLAGASINGIATKAIIVLDNKLQAFSEAGTQASVQKKTAGPGVIIEVIPEPTTGLLMAAGLAVLGIRTRRTRV